MRGAYVAQAWKDALDPEADYAFLIVTPSDTNPTQSSVQMAVGGFALGHTPSPGQQVTVAGYPSDLDDAPVICATTVYLTKGYPAFDCAGYDDGTSGSPWIANYNPAAGTGMITAVIGGLNQGGCSSDASYSSPLTTTTDSVFARAESGAPPDNLPQAGSDGC